MSIREGKHRKPIHLAAHFPGVNSTTVWTDPESGSQIEFDSFAHMARTAERGFFDFFFLAEGLRLREHRGQIYDLDVVGRPDTFTVLAALAAVTDRLGLTGTINTTFNEPFEVARQFATLDQLSDGRAGWNIVTSSDAFTGENFRRGGFLDHADRYQRAEEFLSVAREFWDSWASDAVLADVDAGTYRRSRAGSAVVDHHGPQFDVHGVATLPAGPQGHPILLQAGDSDEGRNFGAHYADALFTLHGSLEDGQRYYADVKGRAASYGRNPDELKVFPAATFVLGDTAEEAEDKAHYIRRQQVSGPTAIAMLEQVWGRDLSEYDPDGPLPEEDPTGDISITQGRVRHGDPIEVARRYRERAEAREPFDPRTDHRRHQPGAVRRHRRSRRRGDRPLHPVRRLRRVHSCAAPDAARPGRVRRPRGAGAAGASRVPYRIQRHTLREHLGLTSADSAKRASPLIWLASRIGPRHRSPWPGSENLGVQQRQRGQAADAAVLIVAEQLGQQLRSAARQQRMTGHQRVAAGQHAVDQIRAVAAGVAGSRDGHRVAGQLRGHLGGQRLRGRDALAAQPAVAHEVGGPQRPPGPPDVHRDVDRRGLLQILALGVADLVGVAVDRGAMGFGEPDRRTEVVDVGVGQQDRPHVFGLVSELPQRGQHVVAVTRDIRRRSA